MGKADMNLLRGIDEIKYSMSGSSGTAGKPDMDAKKKKTYKTMPAKEKPLDGDGKGKQVVSFRAGAEDIQDWKMYATVTRQSMGSLCTSALKEYVKKHKLAESQQAAFDALKNIDM